MPLHLLQSSSINQLQVLLLGLAIIGILIILGSIVVFFTNLNLREKVQEIRLLGADMKISVITFFVFVGLLLILPILYTHYIAAIGEISSVQEDNRKLQIKLEDLSKNQTRTVVLYFDLEGMNDDNFPKRDELHVGYTIPGAESNQLQTLKHLVERHQGHKRVRVQLEEMKAESELSSLEVMNKRTNERWFIEGLRPLSPVLTLKKQQGE